MKRRQGRSQKCGRRYAHGTEPVLPTTSVGAVSGRLHTGDHKPVIVVRTADGGRIVLQTKMGNVLLRQLKRPSGLSAALTKAFQRGKLAALDAKLPA